MENIDLKNRKILYQLDLDARQSNTEIAKKVGLSKDAVGYRIKKLEELKIIRGYNAVIDSSKLGYIFYRVFLNLIDITPKKLEELIGFLKKEKNVWWIAELDGTWNFVFAVWVKSNMEFRDFYNKRLCLKFGKYIKEKLICPLTSYKQFNRSYLIDTKKELSVKIIGKDETVNCDSVDMKILEMLSQNARIPLIDIAHKLKLDSMTIYHRIKKLEKKEIIQGYKVDLNFTLLGRDFYSVKINLKDTLKMDEMINYIQTIPELVAIIEAVGSYDIEFDLEVKNSEQYFKIIENLKKRFEFIREIVYFRVLKNYKILYMPEM